MKKTVVVAVATQALEEKGLGHKRAKECAEHVLSSIESLGAIGFVKEPLPCSPPKDSSPETATLQ